MKMLVHFVLCLALAAPSAGFAQKRAGAPVASAAVVHVVEQPVVDPPALCETAITTAEYLGHLPARLLGAIATTESGRPDPVSGRLRPWPWTINAEGEGHFYATRQDAVAAVQALQARGVKSIDVGCLQVNLMFHPDAFGSLQEAFDPRANARYAVKFLNDLYAEANSWAHAIGAYHSETPALGDAYRVLVMARWQNAGPAPVVARLPVYGAFAQDAGRYGAFAPMTSQYGAFAPR